MRKQLLKMLLIPLIFSIVTIFTQLFSYSFFNSNILLLGGSFITVILFSHLLLWLFKRYDACFWYLFDTIILELLIYLFDHSKLVKLPFEYGHILFRIFTVSGFLLFIYCTVRDLVDKRFQFLNYKRFFISSSVIFFIFYVLIICNRLFIQNTDDILAGSRIASSHFIPFFTIASKIENYLMGHTASLHKLIHYSFTLIVLYIPIGFYTKLIVKKLIKLELFIFLAIPLTFELLQLLFHIGCVNVDDIILSFVGCFIGTICHNILNLLFLSVKKHEFLFERKTYSFVNSSFYR